MLRFRGSIRSDQRPLASGLTSVLTLRRSTLKVIFASRVPVTSMRKGLATQCAGARTIDAVPAGGGGTRLVVCSRVAVATCPEAGSLAVTEAVFTRVVSPTAVGARQL